MNRLEMIDKLKKVAPAIMSVNVSDDMGFEFSAIVSEGVIYPYPGMLINYSGGQWPLDEWEYKDNEEYEGLLLDFLLDEEWAITAWEDVDDFEIEQLLEVSDD